MSIKVQHVNTADQSADVFTKGLGKILFLRHRDRPEGLNMKSVDDFVKCYAKFIVPMCSVEGVRWRVSTKHKEIKLLFTEKMATRNTSLRPPAEVSKVKFECMLQIMHLFARSVY